MIAPGDQLQNRYHVLRSLGEGGFGQVFDVADEVDGTEKVLKVLNLKAFQPSHQKKVITLFQREVEVLSQFHQAGIPQISADGYFVLQTDRQPPLHCLVMEKIVGINLQQWFLQGGVLTQAQAIDWLKQLVTILSYLHQQQFFHRDIKPANIMRRSDGQLVLIDFGAVREMTVTYLVKQQQQETGTAIMSAGYSPPEQAEGKAVPQSDFFALGRTFVYLFTGESPINLPKDPQTGQLIWHDRILPSIHLSPLLLDFIDRLMAPFPGQRPQDGQAILAALHQIEQQMAQQMAQQQRQLRMEQWLPWFRQVAHLRSQLQAQLQSRFQLWGKSDRPRWRSGLLLLLLSASLTGGVNLWSHRILVSDTVNNWGLDHYNLDRLDQSWWFYQLALLLDPKNPLAHFNLGELYEARQQFDQAQAMYEKAIQSEVPEAYNNLGRLHIQFHNYDRALTLLQTGLQRLEQNRAYYTQTEWKARQYAFLKNLGWVYFQLQQYDRAKPLLQQAIQFNPEGEMAQCLLTLIPQTNVKISSDFPVSDQCLQYADQQNPNR